MTGKTAVPAGRPRPALNSWVVVPRPNPRARLRLFCFPYAGAGASVFFPWTQGLPDDVEVAAVQPPGREGRLLEEPFTDLMELVETLGREMKPWMDVPFAFFGHSNGALMAFELARLLRREGRPMPRHIWVSGRPAAQLPWRHPRIHQLPHDEFVAGLRRLQGTPEEVLENAELMELILPLLRADFSLAETYDYPDGPPLDLPISAYGGARDPDVLVEEVHAWEEQTSEAFRARIFPGDHFFVNADRTLVLEELTRELGDLLDAGRADDAAHAAG